MDSPMKKVLFTAVLSAFLLGTVAPVFAQGTPAQGAPAQGDTTKVKVNKKKEKVKTTDGKTKATDKKVKETVKKEEAGY